MASPVAWALYDSTGAPLTGATPAFVDYVTRAGATRTAPAIVELGNGLYACLPTDADEATGVAYCIDNGASATPRRVSGPVTLASAPFSAWHLEDATGALWAGAAPTLAAGSYRNLSGVLAAPAVVAANAHLFSLTPAGSDAATGVAFRADSPAGAWPLYVQDVLVAAAGGVVAAAAPVVVLATQPAVPTSADVALRDFALDTSGDLALLNGDLVLNYGPDGIASDVRARLSTQLGECFLDTTLGFPWRERVLGKKLSPGELKALVQAEVLATPGVKSLDSLDVTLKGRTLAASFRATTATGAALATALSINLGGA